MRDLKSTFPRAFAHDDACLDYMLRLRYGGRIVCPKCGRAGKFHRLRGLPAYACQWCRFHLHPMANTRLARTRVAPRTWFYAIHMFANGGNGMSARQLQQTLGVTYKTAWRMRQTLIDARYRAGGAAGFDGLLAALLTPPR